MSKSIKIVLALGLVAFVAACAQRNEETVFVEATPISVEPTQTGKFK